MAAAATVAPEHPRGHQVPVCVALLAAGADAFARGSDSALIARLNARFYARFEFEDVISDVYAASAAAPPASLLGAWLRIAQPPPSREAFVIGHRLAHGAQHIVRVAVSLGHGAAAHDAARAREAHGLAPPSLDVINFTQELKNPDQRTFRYVDAPAWVWALSHDDCPEGWRERASDPADDDDFTHRSVASELARTARIAADLSAQDAASAQAELHGFGIRPPSVAPGAQWLYDEIDRARAWLNERGGGAAISRPRDARAAAMPAPPVDGVTALPGAQRILANERHVTFDEGVSHSAE